MKKTDKSQPFSSGGLRYKLKIAFALMSILPLLVSLYLVSNYAVPYTGFRLDILVAMVLSFFIALFGLSVLKDIFDHMLSLSAEAKRVANLPALPAEGGRGGQGGKIKWAMDRNDEIGELGRALNQLTSKVRTEMDELTRYSEKTSQINLQIQKHVAVVSNLLQISYLISQDAKLDDILKLIVEKSSFLSDSDVSWMDFKPEQAEEFTVREAVGKGSETLLRVVIKNDHQLYDVMVKATKPVVLDKEAVLPEGLSSALRTTFGFKNILLLPVYVKGRSRAWLGVASNSDVCVWDQMDIKFLDAFARLASISVENDMLVRRLEKLEIKDPLTGLYNEAFIRSRLQEEIKRAILYQRPCSLIVLNVDRFEVFRQRFGPLLSETTLKRIASMIREGVTEVDRVARIEDSKFAIVLPERNKRQAQRLAEEIKKKIESAFSQEQDNDKRLSAHIGVSENPIDGVEAQELIAKAHDTLVSVK